ncbi:MAG: M48 family metallopeptidase, partial [Halomonas sp.]
MDFFTAQDNARRKTGQLVVLLIAAVIALIAVTTVVIAIVVHFMRDDRGSVTANNLLAALSPELVAVVALGVVALVGLGGLFKRSQLRRGGGKVVAEALGGRESSPSTDNANER